MLRLLPFARLCARGAEGAIDNPHLPDQVLPDSRILTSQAAEKLFQCHALSIAQGIEFR